MFSNTAGTSNSCGASVGVAGIGTLGARDQQSLILHDAAADETLIRGRIDSDDEVIAVFDRVDLTVVRDDLEFDVGVIGGEANCHACQGNVRQHDWGADSKSATWRWGSRCDRFAGLRYLGKEAVRALV